MFGHSSTSANTLTNPANSQSVGTVDLLLGLYKKTSGKQDLAVIQIHHRDIDLFVARLSPGVPGSPLEDQFAWRKRGLAYAWDKNIFKRTVSVFVRKLAAINCLVRIEPTFQPIASLVPPERYIVWQNVKCVGRDSVRSLWFVSDPPECTGSKNDNRSHYDAAEFPWSEAQQQCYDYSQRNGAEHKTRCQRHANQTHHQKADSDQQSSKLRVQLHDPPRTGVSFGIVTFHRLIVPPVQAKNHLRISGADKSLQIVQFQELHWPFNPPATNPPTLS